MQRSAILASTHSTGTSGTCEVASHEDSAIIRAHGGAPFLCEPSLIRDSMTRTVRSIGTPCRCSSNAAPAMAPARAHVARSLGTPGMAEWAVPQSIAEARMMCFMGSFIEKAPGLMRRGFWFLADYLPTLIMGMAPPATVAGSLPSHLDIA